MANKIQHGIKNVYLFPRNDDGTYQPGIHMPGAENMGMSNSGSGDFTVWADDGRYHNESTKSGKEGDLQMAKFPTEYYKYALGQDVDQYGGFGDTMNDVAGQFALAWELTGDKGGRRVVWYGCTGTEPTFTSATDTDSKTEASETSTITASYVRVPETVNGTTTVVERCQWSCEKGHPLYNNFFTQLPHATMSDGEDVTLSTLTVGTLRLSPNFNSGTIDYTATTTSSSVDVTAIASDADATVAIKNGSTTVTNGGSASLSAGENTITVTVTNGESTKVYTVVVTKS